MPQQVALGAQQFPQPPAPMEPAQPFRSCGGAKVRPSRGGEVKKVFRFFKEYEHALSFAQGKIWISTLDICRKHENAAQGDAGEGTLDYEFVGTIAYDGMPDPMQARAAQLAGIHISGAANVRISNPSGHHRLPDALVLCCTEKYSPELLSDDFGKYCVEITDPTSFFRHVSIALWERYDIGFSHLDRISYLGREYKNYDFPEVHPGFLKPAAGYENQHEVRMLWQVNGGRMLTPGIISVPEATQFCHLIEPSQT